MANNLHPAHFPVGSPASRAAARALVEERRSHAVLVDLVITVKPHEAPWFSEWEENSNGTFTRRSRIPSGMSFPEAERAAGLIPVKPRGEYTRLSLNI